MRLDYRKERFSKVSVCGVECEFNDMRIERSSVPDGKHQYEAEHPICYAAFLTTEFPFFIH